MKDWNFTEKAPLPMLRRKGGEVLGFSRWTWPQPDSTLVGHTVRWDADLGSSTSFASRITLMPNYFSAKVPLTVERQVFEESDGSLRMAAYSKTGPSTPEGLRVGRRYSHLLRSADGGKTWSHDAVIGPGGEPAVAKTGDGRMTALLRVGPFKPFHQVFSEDDGRTWSAPVLTEEGSVCPDLAPMTNGLLACSYGRPARGDISFSPSFPTYLCAPQLPGGAHGRSARPVDSHGVNLSGSIGFDTSVHLTEELAKFEEAQGRVARLN
ncbi:MAG: glycoside hydrolase [Verrucomicrobiota bacterium]|nr:glycoside hydrolase [Verrucomicrobiota bacterium]